MPERLFFQSLKAVLFSMVCLGSAVSFAEGEAEVAASTLPPVTMSQTTSSAVTASGTCREAVASASYWCAEKLNPKLQEYVAGINLLMQASDAMNVNSVCTKQSNILGLAKAGMSAFTATCGAKKYLCDSACSKSKAATDAVKVCPANDPSCGGSVASLNTFNAAALKSCESYAMTLASGAVGIANLVNKISSADQCKEATATNTSATSTPVDCSGTANDSLPECICLKSPRTAGCPNASASLTSSTMQSSTGSAGTTASTKAASTDSALSFSGDTATSTASFAPSGSGSSAGGSAAAGGGGSGNSARGADASAKSGATQKSTVNPNILSGDSGGGGGGGGGYRSGSSSSSDSSAAYKAYLPGGAKDPSRTTASQAASFKGVTGSGGEDNWSKVSNRYRDNKRTLMGE